MKMGEPTSVPGLYRDGSAWIVRARLERPGLRIERRKKVEGTETEALALLAKLRQEVEDEARRREEEGTRSRPTVGDYAPRWLDSLKARRKAMKKAFFVVRAVYLERFILPVFGEKEPREIKRKDLEAWKLWLVEQRQGDVIGKRKNPRAGEAYAHTTLVTVWGVMKSLLQYACVQAEVPNPMVGMRFDVEGEARTVKASLTLDELARVLAAAESESEDVRMMLVLGFATGMRFAELSALEWRDVDLEQGTIRVERSQIGGDVGPPKTEATRRLVYVPAEVVAQLRAYRKWQMGEQERRGPSGLRAPLLFPSSAGTYRWPAMLKGPLERCCARAGVRKRLTAHCMRKTANNLIRQAAGPIIARAMVGHATEEMTFVYSDVEARERARAHRDAFGSAFAQRSTT